MSRHVLDEERWVSYCLPDGPYPELIDAMIRQGIGWLDPRPAGTLGIGFVDLDGGAVTVMELHYTPGPVR